MKGTQAAVALGVGYLLGRRKKMRLAAMLAVGAASGGVGRFGPAALRQGVKYIGKTDIAGALGPQVGAIVSTVRGDLLDAGKAAAASAVTSRLDTLTDSLHERAETLRNPEAAVGEAGEKAGRAGQAAGKAAGKAAGRATGGVPTQRRRRGADDADESSQGRDEDEYADDEELQDEVSDDGGGGRGDGRDRGGRARRGGRRSEPSDGDDEIEDEYADDDDLADDEVGPDDDLDGEADEPDDEEADEPAPRRRRANRSPVTRTGR